MTESNPTPEQWHNYQEKLSEAEKYNSAVISHLSFMDKTELVVCGAALVACLNGITSVSANPELYSALLSAASAFFLAGVTRIVAMEFRSSQYGHLRDAAHATASFHLHLDKERHETEHTKAMDGHEKATRRAIQIGALARMATTIAIVWTVYLLHSATPKPALAF